MATFGLSTLPDTETGLLDIVCVRWGIGPCLRETNWDRTSATASVVVAHSFDNLCEGNIPLDI